MDASARATFERLVAAHRGMVLRVCRSIVRDEHLGADAAQETFLRLWRSLARGRAPERFGAWLRRVAITTSLEIVRRRPPAAIDLEPALGPAAGGDSPGEALERRELGRRFEAGLAALPEGQRTVFLLRHAGGLSLAEVSETLGVAPSTAKTQFTRACLRLQEALRPFDPRRDDER